MAEGFKKFIEKKENGAKKKERIRQEKKKLRQETKEYFEQKKAAARELRAQGGINRNEERGRRNEERGGNRSEERGTRNEERGGKRSDERGTRKEERGTRGPVKPALRIEKAGKKEEVENLKESTMVGMMPLNKFIAHAGICSRRDAADVVKTGKVTVNGKVITEPGFKIGQKDEVKVQGKKITARRNLVYILLNKPKDYFTTTEDPQGRKTVLDLIKSATSERVYPIGRLDRNTTGVLLLTNDGELAQKLSHPSYEVRKIYEVTLDKQLTKKDFDAILSGVTLEDGFIQPDVLAYPDAKNKHIIGVEIHSGKNRIVRRIFEHLGYDVKGLDRVMYANLTKKNVERVKWRFLSEKEVRLLKFLNASYKKKPKQ